jgi:hypothetical protein
MGPPEQMKQLAFLVGDWNVSGRWRMGPEAEWQDFTAKSSYQYLADGAIMQSEFRSEMMGMQMIGYSWQCWDRENDEWQVTWTDNLSGRISIYSGAAEGEKVIMTGEDMMGGQTFLTRLTTWDQTDTSFKWKMEHSMDGGNNWYISMEADYSKL